MFVVDVGYVTVLAARGGRAAGGGGRRRGRAVAAAARARPAPRAAAAGHRGTRIIASTDGRRLKHVTGIANYLD